MSDGVTEANKGAMELTAKGWVPIMNPYYHAMLKAGVPPDVAAPTDEERKEETLLTDEEWRDIAKKRLYKARNKLEKIVKAVDNKAEAPELSQLVQEYHALSASAFAALQQVATPAQPRPPFKGPQVQTLELREGRDF